MLAQYQPVFKAPFIEQYNFKFQGTGYTRNRARDHLFPQQKG